jgi:hypothetical protein
LIARASKPARERSTEGVNLGVFHRIDIQDIDNDDINSIERYLSEGSPRTLEVKASGGYSVVVAPPAQSLYY